jgi:hypothetical protein
MLELGQPMHAYDLAKLQGGLEARFARRREDHAARRQGNQALDDVLVIADQTARRHGGRHGRLASSCTPRRPTSCSKPRSSRRRHRRSRAPLRPRDRRRPAVRTRRGPGAPGARVERATQLLLESPAASRSAARRAGSDALPQAPGSRAAPRTHRRLLGTAIADNDVKATLEALGMRVLASADGWLVTPPPHRFDINIEADLIEELARVVGLRIDSRADAIRASACARWPKRAGRSPGARDPGRARLPGSHHVRVRRSGAAEQAVPGRRDAETRQRDLQRHVRHARVVVAGPASRPRRRTSAASRIASGCSNMARDSTRVKPTCWPASPSARVAGAVGRRRRRRSTSST